MNFLRKAVVAAIACSWLFLSGCGGTYRPIASILPLASGNPQLGDTVAVFNVNPSTGSGATGALSVFNVPGDSNVGNFPVGPNDALAAAPPLVNPLTSRLITFAGANSIIATADAQSDTVTLINTLQGTTTTISLPAGFVPSFITATTNTGQILVSLQLPTSAPSGTCAGKGAIGIIDTKTAALANTVCAGSTPGFIVVAQNDTEAFILDKTDNTVSVLNIAAATLAGTPLAVGTSPIWATTSLDGNTIYVLNQGSNNISVIDAVAQVVNPVPISTGALFAPSVIITDRNNRLYISNTGNNTVSVLDASNSALPPLHAPIQVGASPVALAVTPDGSSVYVANTGASTASVINGNSFNVTTLTPDTTDATARVQSVAVSKDGTKAFIGVTVSSDKAKASSTNPQQPAASVPISGNGIYVVLTSNNSLVTNGSGAFINMAPPQDLSCDATASCFVPGRFGSVAAANADRASHLGACLKNL